MNFLVSNNISTLVIGYNEEWKQNINLGRRNNQSFVGIPFYIFIKQLEYKCKLEGINVILIEESYTSNVVFWTVNHSENIVVIRVKELKEVSLYQPKVNL